MDMKVYYAHCQTIYGTKQEQRDMEMLKALGFEIVNPSDPEHADVVKKIKSNPANCIERIASVMVMEYFVKLVDSCDAVAFRALPDGAIPAGVMQEIEQARGSGKLVIELPSCILRRGLTVEQTREYLAESGQR